MYTPVKPKQLGYLTLPAACLLAATAALPANAQMLEEIVVTAQKREQNLQDVGVAVTAFTGDQLKALGYGNSSDIVDLTPGMQIVSPNGGSSNFFTIRGVTQNDFTDHQESPVATYVDDVYVSQMSGGGFLLFDTERVEVLRGPQGTLFGRNATGGLVHFITKKPGDELDGYLDLTYGSFNQVKVEGAVGGPVSDKVSMRISGSYNRHDGVIENRIGPDTNEADDWAGRFQVKFTPSDTFSALINVRGAASDVASGVYQHVASFVNADGLGEAVPADVDYYGTCAGCDAFGYRDTDGDPHAGDYDFTGHNKIDTWGTSATLEWVAGDITITSISDYTGLKKDYIEETDATPTNLYQFYLTSDVDQFSQELRAYYDGDGFRVTGGAYYLNLKGDYSNGLDVPIADISLDNPYSVKTESWAVFGQAEYDLSDSLTVSVGLRWTEEDKEIDYAATILSWPDDDLLDAYAAFNPALSPLAKQSDGDWSGKIQLDWHIQEGTLAYASWNRGLKSGGYNAPLDPSGIIDPVTGALDYDAMGFDSEVLYAYEVGLKTDILGGAGRLNLAAFYYDYKNYQAFDLQGLTTIIFNVDAEIYGVDAELIVNPFEGLDVMLGASVMDATAKDVGLPTGPQDVDIALAPDVNLTGLVRYSWPVTGGTMAAQSDFRYLSSHYFNISNAPITHQDGYAVVNARVSYTTEDGRWQVAAFVKNLFDKEYDIIGFDVSGDGFSERFPGDPRWWGLNVSYKFN